jgi:hypothetical protein
MHIDIGGGLWGLPLGPSLGLIAIGVMLSMTLTASPYYVLFLVPFLGGIAWVVAYVYLLSERLST